MRARPIKVENSIHHRNGPSRRDNPTHTMAGPIPAVTKVYRVLPARKPAAVTHGIPFFFQKKKNRTTVRPMFSASIYLQTQDISPTFTRVTFSI